MREQLRLGLWINDIDAPIKRAIALAATLGFRSVELSLDDAEVRPSALSESGRRHLARLVRNAGMNIASIAAPSVSSLPFDDDQLVGHASTAMGMARNMGVRFSTLHAELGGDDPGQSGSGLESLVEALAGASDRMGVTLALRGGSVDSATFSDLLRKVGCPTLGVAFDPVDALLSGKDPLACLDLLGDQVTIAYIRDASPPRGDYGGGACEIGHGGLELDRYCADVAECVPHERLILRGPRGGRRRDEIERDVARLVRAANY